MRKVLLDACIPHRLRRALAQFDVVTAHHAGLDQIDDSELLTLIEGRFDVLVARDRNLTYQQRIFGRSLAVVVVRTFDQSPVAFDALVPELRTAIAAAAPATVTIVGENASSAPGSQRSDP